MKPILEVTKVSKKFRIQHELVHYLTLRDKIANSFRFNSNISKEDFWALKNISIDVSAGDSLAIIGKNGAGKSTLLKILSRITPPTTGNIICRGRISSLLEVGTGFHPELSGRENIFLNGSILGMRRSEIVKKFDEIVDFAEVEKFLDTPLKHYSSGMQLRLAFSVAAYLEPEILIIDEVLAVGDAAFQKKCMGKMNEVSKSGRTVLFVSHNIPAVRQLCPKAIWLNNGEIVAQGNTNQIIDQYLLQDLQAKNIFDWKNVTLSDTLKVKPEKIRVFAQGKDVHDVIYMDDSIRIELSYYNVSSQHLDITLDLFDEHGNHVFHVGSICGENGKELSSGHFITHCIIPANLLNSQQYLVNVIFGKNQREVLYKIDHVVSFSVEKVMSKESANSSKIPGIIHPILLWETNPLN